MRFPLGALFLLSISVLCAQTPEPPEIARAKVEIAKLRELVDAGAVPRVQLQKAEETLADAQDVAFLRRTLYGPELTEEQTEEMLATATRRLERRKGALEHAQELVKLGAASQLSLGTFLEDVDLARKELDFAQSRAKLATELAEMARAEQALEASLDQDPTETHGIAERYDGDGIFTPHDLRNITVAFEGQFFRSLPISAMGETAVHRSLGFDHRNRVDVAIHPDQPEGVWLRQYLANKRIPYFAFRQAIPGKATNAHIHIGPMSGRIVRGG